MVTQIQPTKNPAVVALDSFTTEATYLIDLEAGVCSCPHFQHRLINLEPTDPKRQAGCKHLQEAKKQQRFAKALAIARKLDDAKLLLGLQHYQAQGDLAVSGAIRCALHERKVAAAADAALRATFA